jgi:glucokinase
LSRDELTLITEAGARQLAERDVARIRQRRSDSVQNGAIIGAAAGAGYGLAMLVLLASMDDGGGPIPAGVVTGMVVFTGLGAAAGAGIDALITRRQVIYEKRGGGGQVSISPMFLGGRRGVAVSVKF